MKFIKNNLNKLIILLLLLLSIIPSIPIFKEGTRGVFYNMDPEMAMVANALTYNTNKIISYIDHPGTPTIFYVATSYLPLRIYSKLVAHEGFVAWTFDHFRFLFLYTRLVMVAAFLLSIFIYLKAIEKITDNWLVLILSWLSLFSFDHTLRLSGAVLTETLSFLSISVWLYIFSNFIKNRDAVKLIFLSIISGIAVANKYNNFPLLITSILLVFTLHELTLKQKFYNLVTNGVFVVLGFVIGTWPVRRYYPYMFTQISKILGQSGGGAAHGVGNSSFFNLSIYFESIRNFYLAQPSAVYTFLFVVIMFGVLLLSSFLSKKRQVVPLPISILLFVTFVSTLFIVKYPLVYYQFANYLLLVFVAAFFASKLPKGIVLAMCILVALFTQRNYQNYVNYTSLARSNSIYLEEYISTNPAKVASLWDFAPTEDFMRIWVRSWSGTIYDTELRARRPDILELKADYKTVYKNASDHDLIFNVCWDKLYIREERAKEFLSLYPDRKFYVKPLMNTGIWEIDSIHCTTKP